MSPGRTRGSNNANSVHCTCLDDEEFVTRGFVSVGEVELPGDGVSVGGVRVRQ